MNLSGKSKIPLQFSHGWVFWVLGRGKRGNIHLEAFVKKKQDTNAFSWQEEFLKIECKIMS